MTVKKSDFLKKTVDKKCRITGKKKEKNKIFWKSWFLKECRITGLFTEKFKFTGW